MILKMILALLWLLPIVRGEQSEDDLLVSTRQTVVPPLLFLTGSAGYYGYHVDGLYLLSKTSGSARPEYQHSVYDIWSKIQYVGDVWTIGYDGNPWYRNPAQTQLPPVSGWVLYDGSPRPDMKVYYYPGYLSSPPVNITLLPTTPVSGVSGQYGLQDETHNGWPVYRGQAGYLYVRRFNNRAYNWVFGSEVSDDAGSTISIQSFPPAHSPASWPDWVNMQTEEEPLLEQNYHRLNQYSYMENSTLVCLSLRYEVVRIPKVDPRRCNKNFECHDGEDEDNCPIFTNPKIWITISFSGAIILIGITLFIGLHKVGILVTVKSWTKYARVGVSARDSIKRGIVDNMTKTIMQDEDDWDESEDAKKNYRILHKIPGGTFLFIHTTMSLLEEPAVLHKVAIFAKKMEEELHPNKYEVDLCFREKIGSNHTAAKLFDYFSKPGCTKSTLLAFSQIIKKTSIKLQKFTISLVRVFSFTLDSTKDVILWIFLFHRLSALYDSKIIDGHFVGLLIYANLVIIFLAQTAIGLFILFRAERMFKIPDGLIQKIVVRCALFLLTPFTPCLVILKVTTISVQKEKLVNDWRKSPEESASTVSSNIRDLEDEILFSMKTYSHLKLLEATLESFPQIVLLLAYLTVSLFDPQALALSENVKSSSSAIFFAFNIMFSIFTLIMSITNSINMSKGKQLSIKQKLVLALSYIFQICSRTIPIFLVIFLTIRKYLSIVHAVIMIICPIIFHWVAQYLICQLTAPSFKNQEFFDQLLHVLTNTFLVIPLRPSPPPGHQVHKSTQIFWSFVLFTIEVLVILFIATYVCSTTYVCFTEYDFMFSIMAKLCYVLLLLGPFTLHVFYNCCHTWKDVNKQRVRSRRCGPWPAWCCVGSLGPEIHEEDGREEEMYEMKKMKEKTMVLKRSKSLTNITWETKIDIQSGFQTI